MNKKLSEALWLISLVGIVGGLMWVLVSYVSQR